MEIPVTQLMVLGTEGDLPAKLGLLGLLGRTEDYLSHRLPFLFLRLVPRIGQRGKEGLYVFMGVLRDFGILMKTLNH